METLAGELEIAVKNAQAALAEARGTEFEAYLTKLVKAGEVAQVEVVTRGAADLRELIAALNEGARATILTLNGRKQLAARKAERATAAEMQAAVEAKATQSKPAQSAVKAEAVQVTAEPKKIEIAQVETVEAKPIELVKEAVTEEILVPNTSAVEVAVGTSATASEWGVVAMVLVIMAATLGILAAQWRRSNGLCKIGRS